MQQSSTVFVAELTIVAGAIAKQIFDRAQLPNTILVQIWNLADTEQRGKLSCTEFIIAMHLLASYRAGALRSLPNNLPAGLYEAAARRGAPPPRPVSGSRQGSDIHPVPGISRQFSGASAAARTSSPLARQSYPVSTPGGDAWVINPQEKAQFDSQFEKLDASNQGFISGEQSVEYFSRSHLPEDDLATIWDLADITSTGQLNRDEFAVAMYLIRQQLAKKGPLPTALPPNLIPPSMRQQAPAPPPRQSTLPASLPKPRSAAEDLFGLDAIAPPAPQVPQSTGGSSAFTPATSEQAGSQTQSTQSSTMFKPFVPTSSFGQSIVTPQATGVQTETRQPPPVPANHHGSDDLLGDADPEVSKRLTNETSELANLSNQVGNLGNQMKDVQGKRSATGQNLSQVNSQKKEFEARLAQLRSAYEQEAREVKSLEERLAQARSETQKVQQDMALVQHSFQGLQEQKLQMQSALEADQKENSSLKERMRAVNNEMTQLKAQLEKIRSEARQQKGLVAINKKQLSTNEAERDKTRSELERTTTEHESTTRELEESKRALENPTPTAAATAATASRGAAASPAPSAASMNPFFRRASTAQSERGLSQSSTASPAVTSPNYNAFDSIFGTPPAGPSSSTPPPPTTFRRGPPSEASSPSQQNAVPMSGVSPSSARPSTAQSDVASEIQPPPPPQSRQITSSRLPLSNHVSRSASPSSSVSVAPPGSRFGDVSDAGTEPELDHPASRSGHSPLNQVSTAQAGGAAPVDSEDVPTPQAGSFDFPPAGAETESAPRSAAQPIPGAFPGDPTPVTTPYFAPDNDASKTASKSDDPFAAHPEPDKGPATSTDDFDSAFHSSAEKQPSRETAAAPQPAARSEFPPIQEFGGDDGSDSDSEKGFGDDFTAAPSVPQGHAAAETATGPSPSDGSAERPSVARSPTDETNFSNPKAAPSRQDTFDSAAAGAGRGDSNQLAAEYSDLLQSREAPNAGNGAAHSATNGSAGTALFGNTLFGSVDLKGKASAQPQSSTAPPPPSKSSFDDFDNDFADLTDAQAADDKGDDTADFGSSQAREGFDEFNPTFDSPAPSKATTFTEGTQHYPFHDFESSLSQSGAAGAASSQESSSRPPAQHTSDDWDAMFAGLDAPAGSGGGASAAPPNGKSDAFDSAFAPPTQSSSSLRPPEKPPLARAISAGTEHDDPILKRLTGMGYPREQSLQALEKFDYNLDKVRASRWGDPFPAFPVLQPAGSTC